MVRLRNVPVVAKLKRLAGKAETHTQNTLRRRLNPGHRKHEGAHTYSIFEFILFRSFTEAKMSFHSAEQDVQFTS